MPTVVTSCDNSDNVTVTISNERGPAGPAGVVEAVEVGDITPVSSGKLVGRHGGGSGAAQEVGLDGGLEFHGANIRREALTGDVTASAGSNATTIANDAVTNAKLANMAEATIKGRASGAGTGDPQDLTAAQVQAIVLTPAAIDTALQSATTAQELGIRQSLGIRQNDRLNTQRHTAAKARAWASASTDPVRVIVAGDSISTSLEPLANMGVTGYFGQGTHSTAGTAPSTLATDDWISGRIISIPVGATVQFHPTGGVDAAFVCSKISIGYIAETGAGGFDIETSTPQRSSGAWEKVGVTQNTENATKIGKWYDVDVPSTSTSPAYKVRITNVTGKALKLICWGVWSHTSWGVTWMNGVANFQGRDVSSWAACPDGIFSPIWTGLRPDMVFSRWADAASNWDSGGAFRTQYDRIKALLPQCDFVQLTGGTSYNGPDSGAVWPAYYASQSQYRVGDVAVAQNDTTKLWGRYTCKVAHTQQADRKPGQGASWATYWDAYTYDPAIVASTLAEEEAQARSQELWAEATGESFLDVRDVFGPTYLQAFTNGLIGDFIHPTSAGWEALLAALNQRLAVSQIPLGGMATGGLFQFSIVPGGAAFLDRPLDVGTSGMGGTPSIRVRASDAGTDSRKALLMTASGGKAIFNVDASNIFEAMPSANGAGQHALMPSHAACSLGIPSMRWRCWLGGVASGVRTVTGATTIAASSDHTILCNATGGAFAITFPTAASCAGQLFVFKKNDSSGNAITLSATIDGVANPTLTTQWQVLRVRSDGAAFYYE